MAAIAPTNSSDRALQAGGSVVVPSVFSRVVDITGSLVRNKVDLTAKAIYIGIDWAEFFGWVNRESDPEAFITRDVLNLVKLAHAPGKFISELGTIGRRVSNAWEKPGFGRTLYVIPSAAAAFGYGVDAIDLARKTTLVPIPSETFKTLKQINSVALIIGQGWFAVEKLGEIAENDIETAKDPADFDRKFNKFTQTLIDLAKAVSYVALGVLSMLSYIFLLPIGAFAFLVAGSVTTAFTIISHFHNKLTAY
jgi:hypothetical protein